MKTPVKYLHFSLIVALVLLSTLSAGLVSCKKQTKTKDLRPRVQLPVPEGWEEIPFVERAPEPVLTEKEKERSFLLFQRPVVEPVYKNTRPKSYERCALIKGFGTPGEFEPLTLSIYPVDSLKNLRVDISELKKGRNKIKESDLDVRLVTYWNIPYPYWISKGTYRNVPELLEKVTVNDVPPFECQRYWITLHVPDRVKAGIYEGVISIDHDGLTRPVKIPVKFRVLGFRLKKDPNKHFTAYFSSPDREYKGLTGALYERAVDNELQAMLDHGFDMTPTMSIFYRDGKVTFGEKNEALLKKMLKMGFKGPVPMDAEGVVAPLLEEMEGISRQPHWRLKKLPSEAFYEKLTRILKAFKAEWDAKDWPDFYLNPVDEVDPTAKTFGINVYKATKAAGIKTYITKSSTSPGAMDYGPYINAWCSQPYDVPYQQAVSGKFEYWSYPNHNAGERKNRLIMMKGGRMTYGYGFWRSGYTVLIPWHWRWVISDNQFNYFDRVAPCGMRMDENGEIVPAIYWECFREGYDDLRYLYTLEQAITARKGSAQCNDLIRESEELLQQIWDHIQPQKLYLKTGMWPSGEFAALRWKIATQITKLMQCPAENKAVAPSVLDAIDTGKKGINKNKTELINREIAKGRVKIFDLGMKDFSRWHSLTKEGSIRIIKKDGKPAMRFTVRVDHKKDGEYEDGKYPVGWPRIEFEFHPGEVDFTSYDYLRFYLTVRSDRDEIEDSHTQFGINFQSRNEKVREDRYMDLGDVEGQRIPVEISIPEMLASSFYDPAEWKDLQYISFVLPEKPYRDGTVMNLTFEQVYLLKFKVPVISEIEVPAYVNIPSKWLRIKLDGYGFREADQNGFTTRVKLVDPAGETVKVITGRFGDAPEFILNISSIRNPGTYSLQINIMGPRGKSAGYFRKEIQFSSGYLSLHELAAQSDGR